MELTEQLDFSAFLERFPIIELPVQIDSESFHDVNSVNEPLPNILVSAYLQRTGEDEDLAEYVPVFRLPGGETFVALVYWRAGLLKYAYLVATYTLNGGLIDQTTLASTIYSEEKIIKSIAKFDEEGFVTVIEGVENAKTHELSAAESKQLFFEILDNGTIQQSNKLSI